MTRPIVASLLLLTAALATGAPAAQAAGIGLRPGTALSLNPQPLPPRWNSAVFASPVVRQPGGEVMLNPQPLPPRR